MSKQIQKQIKLNKYPRKNRDVTFIAPTAAKIPTNKFELHKKMPAININAVRIIRIKLTKNVKM